MSRILGSPEEPIIVAVIDDEAACRDGLARLLTAAGLEARAFASARQFLDSSDCDKVSCVVSDILMPGVNGLELQAVLRDRMPHVSILFVTGYGEIPDTVSAMKAGAVDFLEKPVRGAELLEAINRAIARTNQMKAIATEQSGLRIRYETLTPRECDVMALVAAGLLNKQVAAELGIAEKTIKQHRGNIMRKMNAESLADLVMMAARLGVRPTGADFSKSKGRGPLCPTREL
jgi:FixJ family two-component response regulator